MLQILINSPVVSWRGWETPPPPPPAPRLSCHSLLNHGRVKTSLSVVACFFVVCYALFTFGGWTGFSSTSGSVPPARKLLREFRALGLLLLLLLLLPALQGGRGSRRCLGVHLVLCLGGLPLLSLDLGPARGVGVPLGFRLGRAGSLPLLLLLRGRAKWELPARCRRPFPAPPMSLTLPNSHCTFHDVGIRGSLRHLAPAFYPPVVPDLRIADQGRIRGLGHERVARVDVAVVLALAPLPVRGQEVESVDNGHRPRRSLLVPSRAESGRGLLTATARGVEVLGLDVTGLDPQIDTGLDVNGRGRLTSTARAVSVRVPLPAGVRGVTTRGHPLSRIARVTARGQAGDYLAPLPACGRRSQDGWPDEKPRRVFGRLPRSLLWFLKRRRSSLLLQEGRL